MEKKFTQEDLDRILNKVKEGPIGTRSQHTWNMIDALAAKTNYLSYDIKKHRELAKPFNSTSEMIKYKGPNQREINLVGVFINRGSSPFPEWFNKNTVWTDELLFEEVKKYNTPAEFLRGNPAAYQASFNSKNSEKIFASLTRSKSKPITKEDVIERLKKYSSYKEFRENDQPAYLHFRKHKMNQEDYFGKKVKRGRKWE